MPGVRVSNVPHTVSVQELQAYFQLLVDSRIDSIYYPLLNNEAVITFQDKLALAKILSMDEIYFASTKLEVKILPHQAFGTTTVLLEDHVTSLILTTDKHKEFLKNTVEIISTTSNELALRGSWYELEWAWNYLDRILDHQHHIEEHLAKQQRAAFNPPITSRYGMDSHSVIGQHSYSVSPESGNRSGTDRLSSASHIDVILQSLKTFRTDDCRDSHNCSTARASLGKMASGASGCGHQVADMDLEVSSASVNSSDVSSYSHARYRETNDSLTSQRTSTAGDQRKVGSQDMKEEKPDIRLSHSEDADNISDKFTSLRIRDSKASGDYLDTEGDGLTSGLAGDMTHLRIAERHFTSSSDREMHGRTGSRDNGNRIQSERIAERPFTSSRDREMHGRTGSRDNGNRIQLESSLTEFNFTLVNGLQIYVYEESIINASVECVVNAANSYLMNSSGVARAIEEAAGPEMQKECETYIVVHGRLPVSHAMHTNTVGKLGHLKCIIHTVGPIYSEWRHDVCVQELTDAFYNCLKYADEKTRVKSLAFPFISTGIFGLPLECCVEAFLDALVLFASECGGAELCLEEVHLVNNDNDSVCLAIVMLKQCLEKPFDSLLAQALHKQTVKSSASLLLTSRATGSY